VRPCDQSTVAVDCSFTTAAKPYAVVHYLLPLHSFLLLYSCFVIWFGGFLVGLGLCCVGCEALRLPGLIGCTKHPK
jgi:hypothetical protein